MSNLNHKKILFVFLLVFLTVITFNSALSSTIGGINIGNQTLWITYDTIEPSILLRTINFTNFTSNPVSLIYNVSDATSGMLNCSVQINNTLNSSDTAITKDINQSFNITFPNGHYQWNTTCYDTPTNVNTSETRFFTVLIAGVGASAGGGGGSGGAIIPETITEKFTYSDLVILKGKPKELIKKEISIRHNKKNKITVNFECEGEICNYLILDPKLTFNGTETLSYYLSLQVPKEPEKEKYEGKLVFDKEEISLVLMTEKPFSFKDIPAMVYYIVLGGFILLIIVIISILVLRKTQK